MLYVTLGPHSFRISRMYILARVTFERVISFVIHDTKQCVTTGGCEVRCPNRKDETKANLDFGRVRNDLLQLFVG